MAIPLTSNLIKVKTHVQSLEGMYEKLIYMLNVINPDNDELVEDFKAAYAHYKHIANKSRVRERNRLTAAVELGIDDIRAKLHRLGYSFHIYGTGYLVTCGDELVATIMAWDYETVIIDIHSPIRGIWFDYIRDRGMTVMRFRKI